MFRILISETNIERVLNQAIGSLKKGNIIAYPTETFYGLGVKFNMEDSLQKLCDMKQRPQDKAMPLIIGSKNLLHLITEYVNCKAVLLMERFWPGPLTLLFAAKQDVSRYITGGTGKVGVRVPGGSFALHLAKMAKFPITATSANLSGMPPAKDAETVIRYFGDKIGLTIDGGSTPGGLPSTIVDVTGEEIKILREGAIDRESLREFLKKNS
jgi:L-threonylcarbamoyladenylate synthase